MTNFSKLKDRIWYFARRNHPEGMLLTTWLLIVRTILFPVQTFYWRTGDGIGYQWEHDLWIIDGVKYSSKALNILSQSHGEIYKIECNEGLVTLKQLTDEH